MLQTDRHYNFWANFKTSNFIVIRTSATDWQILANIFFYTAAPMWIYMYTRDWQILAFFIDSCIHKHTHVYKRQTDTRNYIFHIFLHQYGYTCILETDRYLQIYFLYTPAPIWIYLCGGDWQILVNIFFIHSCTNMDILVCWRLTDTCKYVFYILLHQYGYTCLLQTDRYLQIYFLYTPVPIWIYMCTRDWQMLANIFFIYSCTNMDIHVYWRLTDTFKYIFCILLHQYGYTCVLETDRYLQIHFLYAPAKIWIYICTRDRQMLGNIFLIYWCTNMNIHMY